MAEELDNNIMNQPGTSFDDATMPDAPGDYNKLVTLEALEHIRRRPGMYIGKLGDGSQSDDGIYVLLKEVLDNSSRRCHQGCIGDEYQWQIRHRELQKLSRS